MNLPSILVIGGANLDITGNCDNRLIPGDSNPGHVRSSPGGVGRNVAENLARLGLNCSLVSAVGQDLGRDIIRQNCVSAGINVDHLIEYPDSSTGTYVAINNQLGALLAAISDMDVIQRLTPDILATKEALLLNHRVIVAEANLPQSSLRWLADHASTKLFVDAVSATKAPKVRDILQNIDVLKVNREEASAILEMQGSDLVLAKALHERGVNQVLLSQGPQGAMVFNHQGAVHKSAIKGKNVSDTGAGDALFSGFIAARELFPELDEQLGFAIACATLTLNSPYSVNPELTIEAASEIALNH